MSLTFLGDYANPNQPLWLSYQNPSAPPSNIQVSTVTTNPAGAVVLPSNGAVYPNTDGGNIQFNRSDNVATEATILQMVPSKNVPIKTIETTYLASTRSGGFAYDDIAVQGLQIYGNQPTAPAANNGAAGYLTQGPTPFSVRLYTGNFNTNVINATSGNFSTLTVSSTSFALPNPLILSSLTTGLATISSLSTQVGYISTLRTQEIVTSTILVSTFAFPNNTSVSTIGASTLTATNANITTISSGTITAGIGTFSTLNAPGGTTTVSSITTNSISTATAIVKELFLSTMTFNATVSPNIDLGMGGFLGGLAAGFTSNTLGVALGAANLATGIGILAQGRQSGGINPSVFQTINGTAQLQFSTLGATTQTTFVDTESLAPTTTPGFERANVTFIGAGTYCMRTVSDPLNLLNASGAAEQGIQGFSQWVPVYPGYLQVKPNSISSILTGNTISLGESLGDSISILPAPGRSVRFSGTTIMSTSVVAGSLTANAVTAPTIQMTNGTASTLAVSTFTVGSLTYTNLNVSNNLTVGNSIVNTGYCSLSNEGILPGGVTIGNYRFGLVPKDANSLAVGNDISCQSLTLYNRGGPGGGVISGVSTINGQPYVSAGPGSVTPTGAIIAYAGQTAPTGWVICDGTSYDSTVPLYQQLYAVIAQNYGGTGNNFMVPDMRARTIYGASNPGYGQSLTGIFEAQGTGFQQLFVNFPGTTVPAGTAGSGRQAIAIYFISPGQEIAIGMQIQAQTGPDINFYGIVAILNYSGNSGTYSYPNYPILILNQPMTADLADNTRFNVKYVNQGYTMGRYNNNNYITQGELQVAGYLHGNKKGGLTGPIDIAETTPIGDPTNNSSQSTQGNVNTRYYQLGPPAATPGAPVVPFNIPTVMEVAPSYLSMNYIIKL